MLKVLEGKKVGWRRSMTRKQTSHSFSPPSKLGFEMLNTFLVVIHKTE